MPQAATRSLVETEVFVLHLMQQDWTVSVRSGYTLIWQHLEADKPVEDHRKIPRAMPIAVPEQKQKGRNKYRRNTQSSQSSGKLSSILVFLDDFLRFLCVISRVNPVLVNSMLACDPILWRKLYSLTAHQVTTP